MFRRDKSDSVGHALDSAVCAEYIIRFPQAAESGLKRDLAYRANRKRPIIGVGKPVDDSHQAVSSGQRQEGAGGPQAVETSGLLEPVRAAFTNMPEADRYRLLASLLLELADLSPAGKNGGSSAEQLAALTKRIQALGEEKATLSDTLATTRADLAHRTKQLEAERARGEELQPIVEDQRSRLESLKRQHEDLEAQVVAKNAELHRLEVVKEGLELKLQRAESSAGGEEQVEALEEKHRRRSAELAEARAELEQLRGDKDAEIERLKEEIAKARSGAAEGGDVVLAKLWERLAKAKPPLAPGHLQPNAQAGERLVDAFVELVRFVDDLDKSMRVFLGKYTRHHPSVKVPWDVYAKRDDIHNTAQQTVAPQGGKPVGLLKMRLRVLYSWTQAAMIGCDSAIESIASELQAQLMGPDGAGSDPNRKIKEYLRDDGHELFLQHIRELRSQKLAETYGRGG